MIPAFGYLLVGLLLAVPAFAWISRQVDQLWPQRWTPAEVFGAIACALSVVGFMALLWPLALAFWGWDTLERRGKVPEISQQIIAVFAVVSATIGLVCFVVFLWPVLLVLIAWGWLKRKDDTSAEAKFTVPEAGLIEALSVAEIERRELVDDPLGGAPRLAFGHLNPVWRGLMESVTPESTIWTFSTVWEAHGGSQQIQGYVVKSDAGLGPQMITSQRRCPMGPAEAKRIVRSGRFHGPERC
jgi:hypothetical protein